MKDFKKDNMKVLRQILKFLDVDAKFKPEFLEINKNKTLKSPGLQKITKTIAAFHKPISKMLPEKHYQKVKSVYEKALKGKKKKVNPEFENKMKKQLFSEVKELGKFLGKESSKEVGL